MLPPFLAAAGYIREAVEQMEGYHRLLCDPRTGLFHHIWNEDTGRFDRADYWGGASGWAVSRHGPDAAAPSRDGESLQAADSGHGTAAHPALEGVVLPGRTGT